MLRIGPIVFRNRPVRTRAPAEHPPVAKRRPFVGRLKKGSPDDRSPELPNAKLRLIGTYVVVTPQFPSSDPVLIDAALSCRIVQAGVQSNGSIKRSSGCTLKAEMRGLRQRNDRRLGATTYQIEHEQNRQRDAEEPQHDPTSLAFTGGTITSNHSGRERRLMKRHVIHLFQ